MFLFAGGLIRQVGVFLSAPPSLARVKSKGSGARPIPLAFKVRILRFFERLSVGRRLM
jgi:hypothetical protein